MINSMKNIPKINTQREQFLVTRNYQVNILMNGGRVCRVCRLCRLCLQSISIGVTDQHNMFTDLFTKENLDMRHDKKKTRSGNTNNIQC